MGLTVAEGEAVVKLAREAVQVYLKTGKIIGNKKTGSEALQHNARVFVTILSANLSPKSPVQELRGCIGYLEPRLMLTRATILAAISAATADPRFPPMVSSELENVIFEVNVLSDPREIDARSPADYPRHVRVGKDGLIIAKDEYRGILLPGVALEWGWSPEEFLIQCSLKAGLQPDAWLDRATKVYAFQSEIFREAAPFGRVLKVSLSDEHHPPRDKFD